jgi:hypothetical protein
MKTNFPSLDITKKVNDVERHFWRIHGNDLDQETNSRIDADKAAQLQDVLQHAMKGSRFSFFFQKHLQSHRHSRSNSPAGFFVVTLIISQALAAKTRLSVDSDQHGIDTISVGSHLLYLTESVTFQSFIRQCVTEASRIQLMSQVQSKQAKAVITPEMLIPDFSMELINSLWHESQQNFAVILKDIALDPDNHESPWNNLPIMFNLEDESRFFDVRFILIEIIRTALVCLRSMCEKFKINKERFSGAQIYYLIKNIYPKSSSNALPAFSLLTSLVQNNFQIIDRTYTDAIYSSLFSIMDSTRNPTSKVFVALLTNQDGIVDFSQQCRVLEYVFKNPFKKNGKIIIPRLSWVRENGKIVSLRQFFDRKFAIEKTHDKPFPNDHPFAYIQPPSWALDVDNQKRNFIEPWDVLVNINFRVPGDFRSSLYGAFCPSGSIMIHVLESENNCLKDFNYNSSLREIEAEWAAIHADASISAESLEKKELELKREWWYCVMLFQMQFLCSCYSLVAKLCENRNMATRNFFFGSSKQFKEDFFVQTWGSRHQIPIIKHEGSDINDPQTHHTIVSFDSEGLSTVAAVTSVKPLNPTCANEVSFPSRSFMYYEVYVDSIKDSENAILQIGWTIGNRERNADHPSDGNGCGYFPHSWGIDGIRQVKYEYAIQTMKPPVENYLKELETRLKVADGHRLELLRQDCTNLQVRSDLQEAEFNCQLLAFRMKQKREFLEQLNAQIRATEVRIRFNLRVTGKVENKTRIRDFTDQELEQEFSAKIQSALVDCGLLVFHGAKNLSPGVHFTPEMQNAMFAHDENEVPQGSYSFRWKEKSVVGIWFDMDRLEIGIVQDGINDQCRQTVFKYNDYAFHDDRPDVNVSWKGDCIVPCISGRGVTIKINLGLKEGGNNNDFKFFNRELANFNCNKDFDTSLHKIRRIQEGQFHTPEKHHLQENEFVCVTFPPGMTSIGTIMDRKPYRVRVWSETSFSLRDSVCQKCYQTDAVIHPRVMLTGKVSYATFAPCCLVSGQQLVDVTFRWNELFEKEKVRQISLTEMVFEDGSKRNISNGLADVFCDSKTGLHLFPNISCELKIYPRYTITDVLDDCNVLYSRCQGFIIPSMDGMYAQEAPNFAFSDGSPVMANYISTLDMAFCTNLPFAFRSSCIEILRTAYIDQEPWFVTPPINTFRTERTCGDAVAAVTPAGAYPREQFTAYGYMYQDSDFGKTFASYSEADILFFEDLYYSAYWEMEMDFGQNPASHMKDFGNKNFNESELASRKTFLLLGFKSPPGKFQLSTRDIVIFWGRAVCQLFQEKLKSRVLSDKNQDSKVFCKELIDCLMVTLRFEFEQSWIGVIHVRSRVIQRLQQCILSYLKEIGVAQDIANANSDQKHDEAGEESTSKTYSSLQNGHHSSFLMSCWTHVSGLFHRSQSLAARTSNLNSTTVANEFPEIKHNYFKSRIPPDILMHSNFVNIRTLESRAKNVTGDKLKQIENKIKVIEEYEKFAAKRGNPSKTFTFVEWQKSQGADTTPNLGVPVTVTHKQVPSMLFAVNVSSI